MKILKKVLKWTGLSIGSIILILIFIGLSNRVFGPAPHPPQGEMIEVEGVNFHINVAGKKHDKPTLVIEAGGGFSGEYYHWLSEGLKDSLRVVRYDRAGIGYSEASDTPRDPETIARELHALLEAAGEAPPYIMAGHSLGGPYVSVFSQLYPDEVEALVLIDATHPERVERLDLMKETSFMFRLFVSSYKAMGLLGDLGLLGIYDRLWGPVIPVEGLPEEVVARTKDYALDGKVAWTFAEEMNWYHRTLKRANIEFGSMPIRTFHGDKPMSEKARKHYQKRGIDIEKRMIEGAKMREDFTRRSSNSQSFSINGDHNSMYTLKENADIICREVILLLRELGY